MDFYRRGGHRSKNTSSQQGKSFHSLNLAWFSHRRIRKLSAWKAITVLPHALESTLAILVVRLQDAPPQTGQPSYTSLNLRQAYASALIRMVNGLVDPLQVGAFARSIASIAAQLGLPSWLVELRHAATHEDLPSLELLRDAAREVK